MTPAEATNILVILGIPILVARVIVVTTYEQRTSKLWTQGLPTAALLLLFLRIAVSRNFSAIISANDWVATASFAGVVVTQFVATVYGWWPGWLGRREVTVDQVPKRR